MNTVHNVFLSYTLHIVLLQEITSGKSGELKELQYILKLKLNSVALVRERTIPTERPPPVGEVSAKFAGRGVSRGQRNGSPRPLSLFSRPGAATFLFK
jgi:hypothetical protein